MNDTQTQPISPQPVLPQTTSQLDPSVLNLMSGIKQVESKGDYNAKGASGEIGAYQYMPSTFSAWAGKYLGNPNADITDPATQNKVAYARISDLKSQGLNPQQIASMWNSGSPNPQGNVGVNNKGVAYNTPQYVANVLAAAQQAAQARRQSQPNTFGGLVPTANAQVPGQLPAQSPSVSGFVGNAFNSAGNLIGGLANVAMHPIETAENVAGMAAGGVEKLFGASNQDTQSFDRMVSYFGSRYGGDSIQQIVGNIGHTLYTDPVGAALDISTFLDGVGGAVGAVAKVSKLGELADAADALQTAARASNPLGAVGKAVQGAVNLGGRVGGETLGVTTGAGYGAIKGAFQAGAEGGAAQSAFRAGISGGEEGVDDLVDLAQQAYQDVKRQQGELYQSELSGIKTGSHTLTPQTIQPIYDQFDNLLNRFGVSQDVKGGLDFSNSLLRSESGSMNDIEDINTDEYGFILEPGNRT